MSMDLLNDFKKCASESDQRRGPHNLEEVRHYAVSFSEVLQELGLAQVNVRHGDQSSTVSARTPLTGPNKDHSISIAFHAVQGKDSTAITYSTVTNGHPSLSEHMRWSERGKLRLIPLVSDWAMQHGGPAVVEKLKQPADKHATQGFGW